MRIVQIGFDWDADLVDPDALLDRCTTLSEWAEALLRAGHESVVVHRFGCAADVVRRGVRYIFTPHHLAKAVQQLDADVIHVNGLNFPVQTWRLRRTLAAGARDRSEAVRFALVVQDHASGDPPSPSRPGAALRDAIKRRAMRSADAFFFVSAEQAAGWRERGFIAPEQPVLEVLEASTSIAAMDRAAARRLTGVSGSPAILWVGRLNANKDPLTVLRGFEAAARQLPDATLTMIFGDGELGADVRQCIDRSDILRARVRLPGRVAHDRVAGYASAADLFVLGSHRESCGYALLEACACGAAPVVSDIPSFRAITGSGSIGALWPPGDAEACARALIAAADGDPRIRSERVRAHFARALSWPAVAARASAAYADVVARVRARSGVLH